jgi:putative phosphoesterase
VRRCVLKLAVVSDTHGNLKGLRKVVSDILAGDDIDLFIHLGDDYDDAEVLEEHGVDYKRVPGVFSDHYADGAVPNRVVEEIEGWKVLLTHTHVSHPNDLRNDLKPEELVETKQVDVVLYGHTHIPGIAARNGVLFVNPGHLKGEDKKGHSASYGLIDISRDKITGTIVDAATGSTLKQMEFGRS